MSEPYDFEVIKQDVFNLFEQHKSLNGIEDLMTKLKHKYYKHLVVRAFWILFHEGKIIMGKNYTLLLK